MRDKSKMSFIKAACVDAARLITPNASDILSTFVTSIRAKSVQPTIELRGERSSWEILAKN